MLAGEGVERAPDALSTTTAWVETRRPREATTEAAGSSSGLPPETIEMVTSHGPDNESIVGHVRIPP